MFWGSFLSWDLKDIVGLNWQEEEEIFNMRISVWGDPRWNNEKKGGKEGNKEDW